MKKLLALLAVCACALTGYSQVSVNTNTSPPTLEGPGIIALNFLSQGTNWTIAPYGLYDTDTRKAGAGIAALYSVTPVLSAGMGLDYINHEIWMPQGDVQIGLPITIMGKLTLKPLAYTGISTSISGRGERNGDAIGIFGAGMAATVYKNLGIFSAWEKRSTFDGQLIRFGLSWKF